MARLTHSDGRSFLASVEYNQLEPLLRASGKGADVNDTVTHTSPYPGNINELVLRLPAYVAALNYTKGELHEFVNPKYKSGARARRAVRARRTSRARERSHSRLVLWVDEPLIPARPSPRGAGAQARTARPSAPSARPHASSA